MQVVLPFVLFYGLVELAALVGLVDDNAHDELFLGAIIALLVYLVLYDPRPRSWRNR